jgi:hypothetical protein
LQEGGLDRAGGHGVDAQCGRTFQRQRLGDRDQAGFRGGIRAIAGPDELHEAGGRVHQRAGAIGGQQRHHGAGPAQHAGQIAVQHGRELVVGKFQQLLHGDVEARKIDAAVQRRECGGERGRGGRDAGAVRQVDRNRHGVRRRRMAVERGRQVDDGNPRALAQ